MTDVARESQPQVVSMYSATYDAGVVGGEFLTIALMQFDSNDSANDHYEHMKSELVASDALISEINNAEEGLIDQVSISVGPTMAEALWVVGDIEADRPGCSGAFEVASACGWFGLV